MLQADALDEQFEKPGGSRLSGLLGGQDLAAISPQVASGFFAKLLARIPDLKKLVRYGSTSVLALVISEITLLLLYANDVVGATSAALLANLSGTIPSYLLARYWIWSKADRKRAGRQVALYWIVSIISMLISSVATGQVSHHTPHQRVLHLVVLACSYLVISMVLWVAKYVVYERTVFKPSKVESLDPVVAQ